MDPFIIKAIQLLLSLSILVVLHELGHFIPAKLFKTKVEKFYLFFDVKFSLFKKKIGDTEYGIGWLPLGGYVKIAGMIDESMDTEQMKQPPQPWEFRSKPAWQRLIIMLGGVTVNFILAVLIYIGIAYSYGEEYIKNDSLRDGVLVTKHELGDKLGIRTGDKIISVDGQVVDRFSALFMELINGNQFTLERNGQTIQQEIPTDFISTLIESEDRTPFLSIRQPFVIREVSPDSQNTQAGFLPNDQVLEINGQKAYYVDQVNNILTPNRGEEVTVVVERATGQTETLTAKVNADGMLGVALAALSYEQYEAKGIIAIQTVNYDLLTSIPAGIDRGVSVLSGYVKQMRKIFNPQTKAYKGVGGFGAIGNLFPSEWDWLGFWSSTALISIILAFMNILPIPALDGGHVMFLLYEIISGRKPNDRFMEYAQMFGFLLLMSLVLFANGNDLYRWLFA
ncbi:MAG: RIP metalloprotease RseP [Flavobacteriaceae bacterium]